MVPTILLGEDDPFFRESIQLALEEHGVDVVPAVNGSEVIAALQCKKPDLLLLDLLMPHTDGFAVLDFLRQQKLQIPVIVLSNLSEDIDTELCFACGVKDYCIKSDMDLEDLWPRIAAHLPVHLVSA